jgi:hypothetical protein
MAHQLPKFITFACWIVLGAVPVLVLPSAALAQADPVVCGEYAAEAVSQAERSAEMQCGFDGPRWDTSFTLHYEWCMGLDGYATPRAVEGVERVKGLKECQAIADRGDILTKPDAGPIFEAPGGVTPPPEPLTAYVYEDVDTYYEPTGDDEDYLGILRAGNTVTLVVPCKKQDWCHVQGPAVPTHDGYVWGALDF